MIDQITKLKRKKSCCVKKLCKPTKFYCVAEVIEFKNRVLVEYVKKYHTNKNDNLII